MADNFLLPEGSLETTYLYDTRRLPPDISATHNNIGTNNSLMYSDRLAGTFNSEWNPESWVYRSVRGPSDGSHSSHIAQRYNTIGPASLSGSLPHIAGTAAIVGTLPIYAAPTMSSTGPGSHFQSGTPISSNHPREIVIPPYDPTDFLADDLQFDVHHCDPGEFFFTILSFSNRLTLIHSSQYYGADESERTGKLDVCYTGCSEGTVRYIRRRAKWYHSG